MPSLYEQGIEMARLEGSLDADPRWQLISRIVQSTTMRRASQLREMLLFLAKAGITNPHSPLREHDIACGVLGRHDNFDPAYDNIVRVQAGHLRRKLEEYFRGEGADEVLRVRLPKGSYLPVFEEIACLPQTQAEEHADLQAVPPETENFFEQNATNHPPDHKEEVVPKGHSGKSLLLWCLITFLLLAAVGAVIFDHRKATLSSEDMSLASRMLPFMRQHGGDVTVVLPDTSLLLVQKLLEIEIPLDTYTKSSYSQDLAAMATSNC